MRKVVLDTETTGLDPGEGHRIIEIGCVELRDDLPSGRTWHRYVNPEREVPDAAREIHRLATDFLLDKPVFAEIADAFLSFIGDSPLIIHNAPFDLGFLNAELERIGQSSLSFERVIDTLEIARRKRPNSPANLDALCRAYKIDLSARKEGHGALIDAGLLARVYLELDGGRQQKLALETTDHDQTGPAPELIKPRKPRRHEPTPEEVAAHAALVERIPGAIWNKF